jgi:hypothetical protein
MSHTKGKLYLDTAYTDGSFTIKEAEHHRVVAGFSESQILNQVTQKEIARRLVACWNSCLKFSTEDIEKFNESEPADHQGRHRLEIIQDLINTRRERDEALDALRQSTAVIWRYARLCAPKEDKKLFSNATDRVSANEAILAKHQKVTG